MRVLVSLEHRFTQTPDGAVWTSTVNAYSFWKRYLDVFDEVVVLARVLPVTIADPKWLRADGPGVSFHCIPCFVGPVQYFRMYWAVQSAIRSALPFDGAVIMRVPSVLSNTLTPVLAKRSWPFALEVVGDPYDVFAPGAVRHPLRALFRYRFSDALRKQCLTADGVAYVTREALQRRYPSRALMMGISDVVLTGSSFTASYSSIELPEKHIVAHTRSAASLGTAMTVAFVGSLDQLYKGPDVLIRATGQLVRQGHNLHLRLVGDGRYREMLERLSRAEGLSDRCQFLGQLPGGSAVRDVLDNSTLFVLPSRVEGLPRAMLEAMARALPCLGSTVGGIPELLDPEDLAIPGSIDGLAKLMATVINDPARQDRMSKRNLKTAQRYGESRLRAKRIDFYKHVRNATELRMNERRSPRNGNRGLDLRDALRSKSSVGGGEPCC